MPRERVAVAQPAQRQQRAAQRGRGCGSPPPRSASSSARSGRWRGRRARARARRSATHRSAPSSSQSAMRLTPGSRRRALASSRSSASSQSTRSSASASARPGRATITRSTSAASPGVTRADASRRCRLTRFRSTAPPTLRETVRPTRGSLAVGAGIARERVDDEMPRRGRAAATVDGVEVSGAREAPAARSGTRHDLGREVLAPAQATALEDGATRARTHALAEAVLLCALALVGLIGALHVSSSVSAGREKGQCSRRAGRRSRTRRAVDNRPAHPRRRRRNPAPAVGFRHPRAAHRLWTTVWKSQECPLRAGFRCRRERSCDVRPASIRTPRPVRTASIDTRLRRGRA